jgi:hypothetical protein
MALVPLAVLALWLGSGREVLTKNQKAVVVTVQDEIFGGEESRTEFQSGPILGYYVGLDAVVIAALLCGAAAGTDWLLTRGRGRVAAGGGVQHERK